MTFSTLKEFSHFCLYMIDAINVIVLILKVRVTDVMDNSIADVKVMASSVTSSDGNTIAENVPLAKGKEE